MRINVAVTVTPAVGTERANVQRHMHQLICNPAVTRWKLELLL